MRIQNVLTLAVKIFCTIGLNIPMLATIKSEAATMNLGIIK